MFSVKTNIPWIEDKLERIRILVDGGFGRDINRIVKGTVKRVKDLTPRSEAGVDRKRRFHWTHIADGWTSRVIGGGAKDRIPKLVVIYNQFTHDAAGRKKASALMKTAAGQRRDYTLLEILEYGSRPHNIFPNYGFRIRKTDRGTKFVKTGKGGDVLAFEVNGKMVFTKRVRHPGTKPYGMVRNTRIYMTRLLDAQMKAWAKRVAVEMAKR